MSAKYDYVISSEIAGHVLKWILFRGGVAVWPNIYLSGPMNDGITPAEDVEGKPATKPGWKYGSEPKMTLHDPEKIGVELSVEVKRFHVATRRDGMAYVLTDGANRRLEAAVEKAGEGAFYVFDYGDYNNAVIMKVERTISLAEWGETHDIPEVV